MCVCVCVCVYIYIFFFFIWSKEEIQVVGVSNMNAQYERLLMYN